MNLPDEAVHEFIEIFEKVYGVSISFEEAKTRAKEFLWLISFIGKPSNKDYNEDEKRSVYYHSQPNI